MAMGFEISGNSNGLLGQYGPGNLTGNRQRSGNPRVVKATRWVAAGLMTAVLLIGAACGSAGEGGQGDTAPEGSPARTPIPTVTPTRFDGLATTTVPRPTPTRVVTATSVFSRLATPTLRPFLTPTIFATPTRTPIPPPHEDPVAHTD